MDKVTGVALGGRWVAALAIAATVSSCTAPMRPDAVSNSPATTPSSAKLTRIVIDDTWDGYSRVTPIVSHWVIEPRESGFVLDGTHSQGHIALPSEDATRAPARDVTNVSAQAVPIPAVDALVHALRAPPKPNVDLNLFGPGADQAGAAIDEKVQRLVALGPPSPLRQRIVDWGNQLRQRQPLTEAITAGMTADAHTDDYPQARVEANFADGSKLVFVSDSQNVLMLPWRDASGRRSFSSDLPRALAALLPSVSANRKRLSAIPSGKDFGDALDMGVAGDYNRFKVQILAPAAYASLQNQLVINAVGTGEEIGAFDTTMPQVYVDVSLPGGPTNLSLSAFLGIKGTGLAKPADLEAMRGDLKTAVAATGLRQAMQSAPGDAFRIGRDDSRPTFEPWEEKRFIAKMSEAHRLPEIAIHPELLDGAVMVMQDDGRHIKGPRNRSTIYWVVLRDGRSVALTHFDPCANRDDCLVRVYDASGTAL